MILSKFLRVLVIKLPDQGYPPFQVFNDPPGVMERSARPWLLARTSNLLSLRFIPAFVLWPIPRFERLAVARCWFKEKSHFSWQAAQDRVIYHDCIQDVPEYDTVDIWAEGRA